ncbi:MAG: multicopper oxidase domain-containing protein [Halobacteriales archaeon]|nr:multicopper oxidase domain-containing protein [Halobacteriales archaeon]
MTVEKNTATVATRSAWRRLAERLDETTVDRRTVLGGIAAGAGGALAVGGAGGQDGDHEHGDRRDPHAFGAKGEYGDGFDPHGFLREFNTGYEDGVEQHVHENDDGTKTRHYEFTALDVNLEVVPGVEFPVPAWTFEGQVPGPTLRAVEGDTIRITFVNGSKHSHTIHPHLKNLNPEMDGTPQNGPGVLEPGEEFTYEWQAKPAGVHMYHCHALPLSEHFHRGMYGVIVVDPDPERVRENPREYANYHGPVTDDLRGELVERARSRNHEYPENDAYDETVMVMNGFDLNFDGDNEVYAVNTRAFAYGVGETDATEGEWEAGETIRPISIEKDVPHRVYLVNATEFDLINSFHTHSQFFDYYDHGTTLFPTHKNVDTIMQCQAQRGIIELDYSDHEPGLYMFHAHQSEFAEQGWMSFFEVE